MFAHLLRQPFVANGVIATVPALCLQKQMQEAFREPSPATPGGGRGQLRCRDVVRALPKSACNQHLLLPASTA